MIGLNQEVIDSKKHGKNVLHGLVHLGANITLMRGEMAALGADMTASEIQYDLTTLTKSYPGSRSQ